MHPKIVRFSCIIKTFFKLIFRHIISKFPGVDIMITFVSFSAHFFKLKIVGSQIRTLPIDFNTIFDMDCIKPNFF